jgi:glutamate-1-semialdehyde 2,1-aminomutase
MSIASASPASVALLDAAAAVIPGGVNTCRRQSESKLCFARGAGAYLWDLEGRRYIDYHAAYGAILLGHSHPAVNARVAETMRDQVLFGAGVTEGEVALARKLAEHIPSAEQSVLCGSGSEATLHAIRLARGVTGREKIVKFQGSYNGFHDYVLRNVLSAPEQVGRRDPHSKGMLEAAVDATLVCRYNDLDDVAAAFAAHEIAAVILEPIGHNAPGIMPAPGFLEGLRRICDAEGALLIFDEVITGFRHGLGGYQAICGVTPDVTTLGKAIANGFPLAAIAGRREYMEHYSTNPDGDVHFGGTFNGGSVAVAAGLATIEYLESQPVHAHIYALGERMRDGLRAIADEAGVEAYVGGYGSLFVLCFMEGPLRSYEDVLRNDNARFLRYRRALVDGGVFEMPESLGRSHISAAHTADDVDRSLEVARDALRVALA